MIIYFSSTGNSKYVAKRIAEAENDWTRSITTFDYGFPLEIRKKNVFGIVCPTYFFGIPANIEEFFEKFKIVVEPGTYCFFVTTYGGDSGHPEKHMEEILKKKGITLNASFSVKMPENYTPMFDVNDKEQIQKVLDAAEPQIDEVIIHQAQEGGRHTQDAVRPQRGKEEISHPGRSHGRHQQDGRDHRAHPCLQDSG